MSGHLRETIYLQCDAKLGDLQCFVRYGWNDALPDNIDAIELLARKARDNGWQTEVHNEGLKGWRIDALCPDHLSVVPHDIGIGAFIETVTRDPRPILSAVTPDPTQVCGGQVLAQQPKEGSDGD